MSLRLRRRGQMARLEGARRSALTDTAVLVTTLQEVAQEIQYYQLIRRMGLQIQQGHGRFCGPFLLIEYFNLPLRLPRELKSAWDKTAKHILGKNS